MEGHKSLKSVLTSKMLGEEIHVCGWIQTIRFAKKGKLAFISLNDGTSFKSLQIVASLSDSFEMIDFEDIKSLTTGCSIMVVGKIVESPGGKQDIEMQSSKITLFGGIGDKDTYPLPSQKQSLEKLRSMLHLRSRTQLMRAIMKVRNVLSMATHEFFQDQDCIWLHTPILTGADCEGAGEMFQVTTILKDSIIDVPSVMIDDGSEYSYGKVESDFNSKFVSSDIDFEKDFFKKKAYLTVSGQLDAESYACGMGNVYTFGPTFRAENSNTTRHLAEFWMIEPEMAFKDLKGIMDVAEDYIKFMIKKALEKCPDELEFLEKRTEENKGLIKFLTDSCEDDFVRITYTEAIEYLEAVHVSEGISGTHVHFSSELEGPSTTFEEEPVWGMDLGSEHERYLCEKLFKKPTIVTDYPKDIKAFYMRENETEGERKTVAAMDILVPGIGELVGGSQREERFDVLVKRMEELDLSQDEYKEYLDLRKYGSVPHSGFGLGFERMVRFACGLENIREAIPFPRWPGHL